MRNKLPILLALLPVALLTITSLQAQGLHLQINHAYYGTSGNAVDVTNRVRRMIQNNSLDFQVTNENLRADPSKGKDKILKISYTYLGKHHIVSFKEGERCRIP